MFTLEMVPSTRWGKVEFTVPQTGVDETISAFIEIEVKVEDIKQIEETRKRIIEKAKEPNNEIDSIDVEFVKYYLLNWRGVQADKKEVDFNPTTFKRYMQQQDFRTAIINSVAKLVNREDLLSKN